MTQSFRPPFARMRDIMKGTVAARDGRIGAAPEQLRPIAPIAAAPEPEPEPAPIAVEEPQVIEEASQEALTEDTAPVMLASLTRAELIGLVEAKGLVSPKNPSKMALIKLLELE